jgi:23S rRNA A2030 N6-methylase RlmJ
MDGMMSDEIVKSYQIDKELKIIGQNPAARRQGEGLDRHNKRVGNKGDVWKHFILCGVADKLLRRRSDSQPFVYADTHCSLGRFPLIDNGQWRQGIGIFYEHKWQPLPDYPYFAIEEKAYKSCNQYLGSWKLVERLLASLLSGRNYLR